MSSFTALMALSASKTQEQNNLVQMAIQERQRKEQLLRKQQAEREARERELEKKLRLKHFEDEKREQERRKKREEEKKAREAALQRRKDEQRDTLLYGPKKASSTKASSSSSGGAGARDKRRLPDEDDGDSSPGNVLTREELRERKQQQEMRRLYNATRKSTSSQSYSKPGKRLPGGAVDITTTAQSPESLAGKSVKDRIAALPNTLTKLNVHKRDTRTIDEIVADIAKKKDGKVLDGDNAKHFDGWFSTKKKDPVKRVQTGSSTNSGANTPTSSAPASTPAKKISTSSSATVAPTKPSVTKASTAKVSGQQTSAPSKAANGSRAGSLDKYPSVKAPSSSLPNKNSKPSIAERERDRDRERERDRSAFSRPPASAASSNMRKRPRSESRSESPPPKRRAASPEEDLEDEISSTIWGLFGRKRDRYVNMDVFSDDEDMEADAYVLEREEKLSARLAKKEDLQAFEEERRHEEEKRRRKKDKERLSRPSQ